VKRLDVLLSGKDSDPIKIHQASELVQILQSLTEPQGYARSSGMSASANALTMIILARKDAIINQCLSSLSTPLLKEMRYSPLAWPSSTKPEGDILPKKLFRGLGRKIEEDQNKAAEKGRNAFFLNNLPGKSVKKNFKRAAAPSPPPKAPFSARPQQKKFKPNPSGAARAKRAFKKGTSYNPSTKDSRRPVKGGRKNTTSFKNPRKVQGRAPKGSSL